MSLYRSRNPDLADIKKMERILIYNGLDMEMIDVINSNCPLNDEDEDDAEPEAEMLYKNQYYNL